MSSWSKTIIQAEEMARILSKSLIPPQSSVAFTRTNRTFRPTVDLTVAHTDTPIILSDTIIYRWLVVEVVGAAFTFRLKSPNNSLSDIFTAVVGLNLVQHDFIEILVTNVAGVGIGAFQVGWKE